MLDFVISYLVAVLISTPLWLILNWLILNPINLEKYFGFLLILVIVHILNPMTWKYWS